MDSADAHAHAFVPTTEALSGGHVAGYDFNRGIDYGALLESYKTTGFQATTFGQAVDEIQRMLSWRLSDEKPEEDALEEELDPAFRASTGCKIFLGYTSNLMSSGVRESVRFLVEHKMVHCVVTTAGGVEEDLIKCLAPTFLGDFALSGADLRRKGINRIGNLLVPNDNYCKFEDWVLPILDKMLVEQREQGVLWTPSRMIHRFGKEINDPRSVYYWAYQNDIPVFCPGLTDGSIGDMLYFHSIKNPGLVCDIIQDIKGINSQAVSAAPRKTGIIVLGGGLPKHHICNANMMRNGADFAVFVSTASEFDGSDSGARPDEAVSWGKIRMTANPVKVYADATLVFPLLVAQTFAKVVEQRHKQERGSMHASG
eukprot:jgi/Mesvir1/24106/Mv10828-RA.1